jgi:hypothetical protein
MKRRLLAVLAAAVLGLVGATITATTSSPHVTPNDGDGHWTSG